MCVPCVYVASSQCTCTVEDYRCIPTCVDAVSVFSADRVEIVADDDEPTKG